MQKEIKIVGHDQSHSLRYFLNDPKNADVRITRMTGGSSITTAFLKDNPINETPQIQGPHLRVLFVPDAKGKINGEIDPTVPVMFKDAENPNIATLFIHNLLQINEIPNYVKSVFSSPDSVVITPEIADTVKLEPELAEDFVAGLYQRLIKKPEEGEPEVPADVIVIYSSNTQNFVEPRRIL